MHESGLHVSLSYIHVTFTYYCFMHYVIDVSLISMVILFDKPLYVLVKSSLISASFVWLGMLDI